jgi:hypothetical protein
MARFTGSESRKFQRSDFQMDCQISEKCPYAFGCRYRELAEFCAYHRLYDTTPPPDPETPESNDDVFYIREEKI